MDCIEAYKERRKRRLDNGGKAVGDYRERRQKRIDADAVAKWQERKAMRTSARKDDGGNMRIPFGLCQREGIKIEEGWTPTDAWDALAKKGITPDAAYSELNSSGSVDDVLGNKNAVVTNDKFRSMKKKLSDQIASVKKVESLAQEINRLRAEEKKAADNERKASEDLDEADRKMRSLDLQHSSIVRFYGNGELLDDNKMQKLLKESAEMGDKLDDLYEKRRKAKHALARGYSPEEAKEFKRIYEEAGGDAEYDRVSGWLASKGEYGEILEQIQFEKTYPEKKAKIEKSRKSALKRKEKNRLLRDKANEDIDKMGKEFVEVQKSVMSDDEHRECMKEFLDNSPYLESVTGYRKAEQELRFMNEKKRVFDADIELDNAKIERCRIFTDGDIIVNQEYVRHMKDEMDKCIKERDALIEQRDEIIKEYIAPLESRMEQIKKESDGGEDWDETLSVAGEYDTVPKKIDGIMRKLGGLYLVNIEDVQYNNVHKYVEPLSEGRIINRLGGGDKTKGSCASLAFAYIANKAGYEVLDFRDGKSREWFSLHGRALLNAVSDVENLTPNDIEQKFKTIPEGKEYYCAAGNHAAIVRKNKYDQMEYLELQSRDKCGWKEMDSSEFRRRFRITDGSDKNNNCLVDIDNVMKSEELISFMGYINTAVDKQAKGAGGYEK